MFKKPIVPTFEIADKYISFYGYTQTSQNNDVSRTPINTSQKFFCDILLQNDYKYL